eukprot:3780089-Rhodomonas_salina.3
MKALGTPSTAPAEDLRAYPRSQARHVFLRNRSRGLNLLPVTAELAGTKRGHSIPRNINGVHKLGL